MNKKVFPLLLTLFLCVFSLAAKAQQTHFDMRYFSHIPVQHEGRLKPLSSYAQLTLESLSAQHRLENLSAEEWLALSLFDPASAAELSVFHISAPSVLSALNLPQSENNLYSLTQIQTELPRTQARVIALLSKPQDSLSDEDNALLELHEDIALYTDILRSFTAYLPLSLNVPEEYRSEQNAAPSFLDLHKNAKEIESRLTDIVAEKGPDPARYTKEEQDIAALSFSLSSLMQAGATSDDFKIFPNLWEPQNLDWFSPWQVLSQGAGGPALHELTQTWKNLAVAYRKDDSAAWKIQSENLINIYAALPRNHIDMLRLKAEHIYRHMHPYVIIFALYSLALCSSGAAHILSRPRLFIAAQIIAGLGVIFHTATIALRIYILARPPVATLFETLLFVSVICALSGLIAAIKSGKKPIFVTSLCCAVLVLLLAPSVAPSGDTLEVLVAVLNTNFWLATHVIIITTGYAFSLLTAALAHLALARPDRAEAYKTYLFSLIALCFMVIGTVLGGIWADQSWGRFWGWDPKENGALLICLWLIWAQHGRVCGKLRARGFHTALAGLAMIVALSWFGVNLLNVGLHSYGFTSGMAGGLAAFCALEILLIFSLWRRYETKA